MAVNVTWDSIAYDKGTNFKLSYPIFFFSADTHLRPFLTNEKTSQFLIEVFPSSMFRK